MYVLAGRPAFALPCVGVHRSTSLMSSSLLLQQGPACLVHLTWIAFMMGGRWPYSWCFLKQFNIVEFPSMREFKLSKLLLYAWNYSEFDCAFKFCMVHLGMIENDVYNRNLPASFFFPRILLERILKIELTAYLC